MFFDSYFPIIFSFILMLAVYLILSKDRYF